MLQRDYIMRLIRTFFEALEKLFDGKQEGEELNKETLESIYENYLGKPRNWFHETTLPEVIRYLEKDEYPVEKTDMLAEALFREFESPAYDSCKQETADKIIGLYRYIDEHSTEYSLLREHRKALLIGWKAGSVKTETQE